MTGPQSPEDRELRTLLGAAHTVAVVGLSSKPHRPSFAVAEYLQAHGYTIIPVNPNEVAVLGEPAYPTLLDIPREIRVEVVDVFRRAAATPEIARDAGARVLWLQEGIVNDEAYAIASDAGMDVIMGVCIRKVSQRLMGEDT
jgi:predicted CoA-binding protein